MFRKLALLMVLGFSCNVFAQEATTGASLMSAPAETAASEPPRWQLSIGQASASIAGDSYYQESGSGLNFAASYSLDDYFVNQLVAVGGGVTYLRDNASSGYDFKTNSSVFRNLSFLFAEVSPIRYKIGAVTLVGSGAYGILSNRGYGDGTTGGRIDGFVSAALTVNLENKIGLRLETKSHNNFASLSTVSLVGYY